jgi:DNA repair exonuclease SbcCD ATPase subunit
MSRSTTAREALIAELIGDIGDLLERVGSLTTRVESLTAEVQSLPRTLDKARKEMRDAASLLDSRLEPFRQQLAAEMEKTKHVAIKAFIGQTNYVAAQEHVKQSQAMTVAARTILDKELEPRVRQFSQTLQRLVDEADRPWEAWLIHAATITCSALCSGWLVLHLLGR